MADKTKERDDERVVGRVVWRGVWKAPMAGSDAKRQSKEFFMLFLECGRQRPWDCLVTHPAERDDLYKYAAALGQEWRNAKPLLALQLSMKMSHHD